MSSLAGSGCGNPSSAQSWVRKSWLLARSLPVAFSHRVMKASMGVWEAGMGATITGWVNPCNCPALGGNASLAVCPRHRPFDRHRQSECQPMASLTGLPIRLIMLTRVSIVNLPTFILTTSETRDHQNLGSIHLFEVVFDDPIGQFAHQLPFQYLRVVDLFL